LYPGYRCFIQYSTWRKEEEDLLWGVILKRKLPGLSGTSSQLKNVVVLSEEMKDIELMKYIHVYLKRLSLSYQTERSEIL
jgi:hypothetical protein